MEILTVKNLCFKYPLCSENALNNISFGVESGDFVTVCGATGSGKSTLLRLLKKELRPTGEISGEILTDGEEINSFDARCSAQSIGFVMQRPEQQIVTDKVWHELAFGLENLGLPQNVIRRRVSEMSSYFGIEAWFEKSVNELSGGQKQLLNLASVMVMQPKILILDEPTAQLDPIAASEFITTLKKLNDEMALTIIIVEHSLEDVIPVCNKLMVLEKGEILAYGETRSVCAKLKENKNVQSLLPSAVRFYAGTREKSECPLTIREGRLLAEKYIRKKEFVPKKNESSEKRMPALEIKDLWFRYGRDLPDVLKGTSLTVYENEIMCILGGNGSGKTTALNCFSGLLHPYAGKIKLFGKKISAYKGQSLYRETVAVLPQDVQTVFLHSTLREELEEVNADTSLLPYDLSSLYGKHPYDLSGGEQQLAAMAKVLASKPKLLFLDEPTKALDANAKKNISALLKQLKETGLTIVAVTHDVEFAASCADRCAMFFRGEVTCVDSPREFFSGNSFYTTAANRMTRGICDGIISVEEAIECCKETE